MNVTGMLSEHIVTLWGARAVVQLQKALSGDVAPLHQPGNYFFLAPRNVTQQFQAVGT
jgi:hypothetical protein